MLYHSCAVIGTVALQPEGPGFDSRLQPFFAGLGLLLGCVPPVSLTFYAISYLIKECILTCLAQ